MTAPRTPEFRRNPVGDAPCMTIDAPPADAAFVARLRVPGGGVVDVYSDSAQGGYNTWITAEGDRSCVLGRAHHDDITTDKVTVPGEGVYRRMHAKKGVSRTGSGLGFALYLGSALAAEHNGATGVFSFPLKVPRNAPRTAASEALWNRMKSGPAPLAHTAVVEAFCPTDEDFTQEERRTPAFRAFRKGDEPGLWMPRDVDLLPGEAVRRSGYVVTAPRTPEFRRNPYFGNGLLHDDDVFLDLLAIWKRGVSPDVKPHRLRNYTEQQTKKFYEHYGSGILNDAEEYEMAVADWARTYPPRALAPVAAPVPATPYDALHTAAGSALRAWMDTHRAAVERAAAPAPDRDAAFRRWFAGSKVVDAAGKPLRVYHGTTAGGFTDFQHGDRAIGLNRLGFWFDAGTFFPNVFAGGDELPRWGDGGGNVLPVYLSLKNPVEYASDPLTRDEYDTLDALMRAKASGTPGEAVPEGEVERIIRRDAPTLRFRPALPNDIRGRIEHIVAHLRRRGWRDAYEKMLRDVLPEGVTPEGRMKVVENDVADAARERLAARHDGIILRSTLTDRAMLNTLRWDHPDADLIPLGRGDNVEHFGSDWYLALRPTQIKSATGNRGTFDPADPDIRHNPRRR